MASQAVISTFRLYTENRNSVEAQTVDLYASCPSYSLPTDDTSKGTGTKGETTEHSNLKYIWKFYSSKSSNTYEYETTTNYYSPLNLSLLAVGTVTQVKVTVKVICKKVTKKWERESKDEGGYTDWKNIETETDNDYEVRETSNPASFNVFSKNGVTSGSIWGNILGFSDITTAGQTANYIDWNGNSNGVFRQQANSWLAQWKIWRSWYDQDDRYNIEAWNNVSLKPTPPISAEWYNACCQACDYDYSVSGGYVQDIRASHFRAISNKVTSWPAA